ncbi:hypothetical protein GCK32_019250 [Trichostrongylus colubriformis]|uniref:Uncharacterized protein n=1 Tax=Trichostrongylus colubriformis TaxID=6319 RepID=A0AAN8FKE7_TRICO
MVAIISNSEKLLAVAPNGQFQSLNDYDGDKSNIVADRARKYWQAVREGRIKIPHYRPAPSLVGVGGNVNVGTAG